MCGIAGSVGVAACADWARLCDHLLAGRGPDGGGWWSGALAVPRLRTDELPGEFPPEERLLILHRRLAVIDPAGGAQPLVGERAGGRVVMAVNGEIYNCRELRRELEDRGHLFTTSSDSEVILHGYEEWESGIFARLDGMFACAVYDEAAEKLVLARDPFGKKPLYLARAGGGLVFASTLPAVLAHPGVDRSISPRDLADFMELWYVPGCRTGYAGIEKLAPGHFAEYFLRDGTFTATGYFRLDFSVKHKLGEEEERREFLRLLEAACRKRLLSDVPLGCFLSGGVDSLAVTALVLDAGAAELEIASIGFDDGSYNELPAVHESLRALRAAGLKNFRHREKIVGGADWEMLKFLLNGFGEPFGDASLMPTGMLCRFARENMTVALSGDGADELLAGYERYRVMAMIQGMTGCCGERLEPLFRRLAAVASAMLPRGLERSSSGRLRRFLRAVSLGATPEAYAMLMGKASGGLLDRIAGPGLRELLGDLRRVNSRAAGELAAAAGELSAGDWREKWSRIDTATYLPGDILPKVDTASMSFGLEVRSPFLDVELARFAAATPWEHKLNGASRKDILVKSMSPRFPFMAAGRRKRGFGIPMARFLVGCWRDEFERALDSPGLNALGFIDSGKARKLLLRRTDKEASDLKWSLTMLANFLESVPK